MRTVVALILAAWLAPISAVAADADATLLHQATSRLSHYQAGQMPVEPSVMGAIYDLAEVGTRREISLLRNLAETERSEIRGAALTAISRVRERQRLEQRASFANAIPEQAQIARAMNHVSKTGLGEDEVVCVQYARWLVGDLPSFTVAYSEGDPAILLAEGKPRKALAALVDDATEPSALLRAQAWEDLGEVRNALQIFATLAASGNVDAMAAMESYGVEVERALLGVLVSQDRLGLERTEAELLEVLVRQGSGLTVRVLAERTQRASASDRATATDALGRMLEPGMRAHPLTQDQTAAIHRALAIASRSDSDPVREIAQEALRKHGLEGKLP